MTRNEARAHQRRFETAGSLLCGALCGLAKWSGEASVIRASGASYVNLLWDCAAGMACYLGMCYLVDRYGERKRWEGRPHYIFISLGGATLLFSGLIIPDLVGSYVRHPGSDWAEMVILSGLFLVGVNVASALVMGAVCGAGLVVRSLRK